MIAQIGRYQVQAQIGRGGFGAVYRAWDPVMRREVAIKVLTSAGDPGTLARFRQEPATTAKLKHKNIITLYDFGEHDSAPYLVMELLEGRSLRDAIDHGPPLSLAEKVSILGEVARGLSYAHQAGVIHRDIKPANIMLLPDGAVKILDFGIGRLLNPELTRQTSSDTIVGTPEYVAPEQYDGQDATALSDVYAYGVMAYECLSGVRPFRGTSPAATLALVLNKTPEPLRTLAPECPEALESIVQVSMAKNPAQRYQSMQDLLLDLGPIEAEFRKARVDGMVTEAQRLLDAGDWDSVQAVVGNLLELEPGHPAGLDLRRRLQRGRERLSIEERWKREVAEVERLVQQRAFDEALPKLEGTRDWLVSVSAPDLQADVEARLSTVREAKERARRMEALLAEAQEAAARRDLAAASRAAAAVLELDVGNTEATELSRWVAKETERERLRKEDVAKVTQSVWADIAAHRFDEATNSIAEAQKRYEGDEDLAALQPLVEGARKAPPPKSAEVPPPQTLGAPPEAVEAPDSEALANSRRKMIRLAVGGTLLLAAAFGIGWLIHFRPVATERLPPSKTDITSGVPAKRPVSEPALPAGATKENAKDGLTYVWIPPGTFRMGCSEGDSECYAYEKPAHQVTVTRGFWMGQSEVTQEAYQRVMAKNPSSFRGAKLPVERITWTDANTYCQAVGMRLSTEAEWEYAARAGTAGSRYRDLNSIAWYHGNSGDRTHRVKGKEPNAWGLYDMIGNVWEWVSDWYADQYQSVDAIDPRGPPSGTLRVVRGSSWRYGGPRGARVSFRYGYPITYHYYNLGVRCAGN